VNRKETEIDRRLQTELAWQPRSLACSIRHVGVEIEHRGPSEGIPPAPGASASSQFCGHLRSGGVASVYCIFV
jgi:hypothetical protein